MRPRTLKQGMTLVELMIVVVIVGVLSVLAITGYRKYTFRARNSEAINFLQSIRAAQEAYYQSFGRYCGGPAAALWPDEIPREEKVEWGAPQPLAWRHLGVKSPGWVWFQYEVRAGGPADAAGPSFENQPERPWFVAQARGDFIRGNPTSLFEITSETETVYVENENH